MSETILLSKLRKSISDEEPLLVRHAVQSLWKSLAEMRSDAKKTQIQAEGRFSLLVWCQLTAIVCFLLQERTREQVGFCDSDYQSLISAAKKWQLDDYKITNQVTNDN